MPVIGQFMRENDGFIGHLTTLSLHQDIIIVAAEPSDAENAPDYRVHVLDTMSNETGAEIGAGWKRTGEKAGDYVSLQLDDPTFDQHLDPGFLFPGVPAKSRESTGKFVL